MTTVGGNPSCVIGGTRNRPQHNSPPATAKGSRWTPDPITWNGSRLLPEGWVAAARRPTATAPRGEYGRHLWLNAGASDDPDNRPFKKLPRDVFYLSGHEG